MRKQITAIGLSVCAVCILGVIIVSTTDTKGKNLVVFGDSISTGYGLLDYKDTKTPDVKESYANLLSTEKELTCINLAVDGFTSQDLLTKVKGLKSDKNSEQYKYITNASIVAVTIGGNDLLNALYINIGTALELNITSKTFKAQVQEKLKAAILTKDLATLGKINATLKELTKNIKPLATAFEENLTQTIKEIKEINKDATIVIQTIINPYKGITGIDLNVDDNVRVLNKIITDGAEKSGYIVADVYKEFNESTKTLTNATNPETFLDPHPNKDGHLLISQIVSKALK